MDQQEDIIGKYCFNNDGTFNNENGNCSNGSVSLYVLHKNLRDAMDKYNTMYLCCTEKIKSNTCNCSNENLLNATIQLNDAVVAYNNALAFVARIVIGTNNQGLYGDILKQRATLDGALDLLKNNQDPRYLHYKSKYDYAVYASIVWGVLASGLLYYVFVKL
jgi:hypothetical protein